MKRLIRLLFEISGLALILLVVGLGALALRLEQGPISLRDYIPEAEEFLRELSPGYNFKIADVRLEIEPQYQSLRVRLSSVRVTNRNHDDVGMLKDMIMGYNWRNIVSFSLMPVAVEIVRPSLDITRFENGYLGFNLKDDPEQEESGHDDVSVDDVIAFLQRAPHALRFIRISDAVIRYHNLQRNYVLSVENGLFDFQRIRGDIDGTMAMDIKSDTFAHRVQGSIAYDGENNYTDVNLGVTNVLLDDIRVLTPDIPAELQLDLPMNLLVTASIDRSLQWQRADILLTGTKGNLLFPPYFDGTIRIADIAVNGIYEPVAKRFTLKSFVTKIGDSSLHADAVIDFSKPDMIVKASAQAREVPVDKLRLYWPQGLGTNARDWVTQFIQDGIAHTASIKTELVIPADKTQDPDIQVLDGNIDFTNITVDYLTPMPPVKNINGSVTFDTENFDIAAHSGTLFDTEVKRGDVRISKLLTEDPEIAINLDIVGPIRDAIETISSEPLQYAQQMGMTPDQFSGTGHISLNLEFPLLSDLELEQVNMTAISKMTDVTIRRALKDLTVTSDLLELTVNTEEMLVTGDALVNQAAAHIQWQEYFTDAAENTSVLQVKGKITPGILRGLRLPIDQYFSGAANADVNVRQDREKTIHVRVASELQGLGVDVPEYGLKKAPAAMGKAEFQTVIQDNGVTTISDAHISWPNVLVNNAMLHLNAAQELESLTLKNIRADRTRGDIIMSPDGKGGSRIVIKGDVIDGSAFWAYHAPDKPQNQPKKTVANDISVRAGTLYLDPDHPIKNAKIDMLLRGADIVRANLSGKIGAKDSDFSMIQVEQMDKTRRLEINTADSGALLRALDILDEVHGGVLTIQGMSTLENPTEIVGDATVTHFTLVKAPVMARILNAFSLGGLLNLLNNDGLAFSKMQSQFILPDMNSIRLKKGKMAGDSLGLSFSGKIDLQSNALDIKGTIVPLDGINKFFGRIPLIGQILTGVNGDGIIGATYKVTGSGDDMNVSINPLSALTPGIFRSILFE